MKLSEAVRKGAIGRKQCRGMFFARGTDSCCALGAAIIGKFGDSRTSLSYVNLISEYPQLRTKEVTHPISLKVQPLNDIITNLNDDHGWSFEKIALWLEDVGE